MTEPTHYKKINLDSIQAGDSYFQQNPITKEQTKKIKLNYNDDIILIETSPLSVVFANSDTKWGLRYYFACSSNEPIFNDFISQDIKNRLCDLAIENLDDETTTSLIDRYTEEDEEQRSIEDIVKNELWKNNLKNGELIDFNFKQQKFKIVDVDGTLKEVDNLDEYITPKPNKNNKELYEIKNVVKFIFTIKTIDISDDVIKAGFHIECIQFRKEMSRRKNKIVPIGIDTFDYSNITINPELITDTYGNRYRYINYDEGKTLCIELKGVKFAPFKIKDVDEETGKARYSVNITLDNPQYQEFLQGVDDKILSLLISTIFNGKVDKKKTKKLLTSGKNGYNSILYYSKKVREQIKNGETPEYPPTLRVKIPVKDGEFSDTSFIDENNQIFQGDFIGFMENKEIHNKLYDISFRCNTLLFKDSVSVQWKATNIKILPGFNQQVKVSSWTFTDEPGDASVSSPVNDDPEDTIINDNGDSDENEPVDSDADSDSD
tara:strand:+ start:605 stop:2077 length:1473 start_codon:yes stop_codon:yes gene_type:complete